MENFVTDKNVLKNQPAKSSFNLSTPAFNPNVQSFNPTLNFQPVIAAPAPLLPPKEEPVILKLEKMSSKP